MIKLLFSFWIGFTVCALMVYLFSYSGISVPLGDGTGLRVLKAPSDWVSEEDIYLTKNQVILNIKGASLSRYAPTGSMRPFLDEGANGIQIIPATPQEIHEGDIITYRKGTLLVVHRVVEKGIDEEGIFFVTQGDNNLVADEKIRFEEIESKTIGILY